ncbi:MAG: DUF4870 domain-containing protein [Flavobacteriaceae bacterium]|jgi:uncharacterized membrane protein|nr:DUF4870 domain-containing protein [Flavobacteriaceae bacterium]MDG1911455.1 DUF4870 domain-containing protein [Flavobacteriaceae bacterium]
MSAEKYVKLPQPQDLSEREKEDAMGAYLMMFAALATSLPLPIINLIAAIVYYYINRKKGRFIHFHCLQSLLSQLPTTLVNWGLLFWALQIFFFDNFEVDDWFYAYLGFAILANLIYFIFSIMAAIRARKGIFMYFLFFGSYAYHRVYGASNELNYDNEKLQNPKTQKVNSPPFL